MAPRSHKQKLINEHHREQSFSKGSSRKENKKNKLGIFGGIGFSTTIGIVAWLLYNGYLETRINTPLSVPKVIEVSGLEVGDRYWGIYRPGVYFGTRVRHPISPVTGLMWFTNNHLNNMNDLRHWCDQSDGVESYTWLEHDGRNFGIQQINDERVKIVTEFVKKPAGDYGGDWTARIKALPKKGKNKTETVSLLYYIALDSDDIEGSLLPFADNADYLGSVHGQSTSIGGFALHLKINKGRVKRNSYLSTRHAGLHQLKESVFKGFRVFQDKETKEKFIGLGGGMFDKDDENRSPSFVVFQVTAVVPFEIDVLFESQSFARNGKFMGKKFDDELAKFSNSFNDKFEKKFNLVEKGYNVEEINIAKSALSNMLGGIGYFYGSSKVVGVNNKDPVPYWKAALYTAVPSRSFFPRGFLWDEGFHNLLISQWDREISMDILGHWFDLMNWDGWIPREQILGSEARARVPDEFVVQNQKAANPPTLLLTLHSMVTSFEKDLSDEDFSYLVRLWPRVKIWYNWFNSTQLGELCGAYRWRGRDAATNKELNPKTLTSGLDDYPRASHPTVDERHLDLRSWMTLASGLMSDIAKIIEKDPQRYQKTFDYLSDNQVLDSLHWSYTANGYMDYGLHTDDAFLKRLNPKADKVRVVQSDPKLRFIDSFGYVSFFPLFLTVIDPQSAKLGKVLEDLKRTDLLWTPYGLRSLASNSPFYNKRNTEHDPPYWRGSIWINMNYLAIRALHYYSNVDGPNKDLASHIYKQLRQNVVTNILKEYQKTGYLWEHYNDKTGKGEGCKPFTGWTALVVLIMGESY